MMSCWRPVLLFTGRGCKSLTKGNDRERIPRYENRNFCDHCSVCLNFTAVARCDDDTTPAADKKAAADKKTAEKPDKAKSLPAAERSCWVRTSDEIKAFFRRGIAVQSHGTGKHASKPKQDRIYTAGELIAIR